VADSESPEATATASLSITITASAACANNANFNGGYAMMLSGWSDGAFGGVVGSFQADGNGNITQGMVDTNATIGPAQDTFTGTYCAASNNLGTMTINLTSANPVTLAFSLQSNGNGNIIFYHPNESYCEIGPISQGPYPNCGLGLFQGSGVLRKQQATAFSTGEVNGSYAFGFSGSQVAEAGVFAADGNGNITSGEYDFNNGGQVVTETISAGSVYSVTSTGRGTATIISTASNPVDLVFYVVSASEFLFLQESAGLFGQGLLQTGPFSSSSLTGNIVMGIEDENYEAQAGLINANGSGSFTLSADDNYFGTVTSNTGTGDYLVASNGRVALSSVTWCVPGDGASCNYNPVFYLVSQNKAFIVGTDTMVSFGKMEPQSGSNFTNASLSGNLMGGSEQPAGLVGEEVDSVSFDGIGTVTGIADQSGPSNEGYSPSSVSINDTYTVSSNGRVVVANSEQELIIYMISTSEFVALTTGPWNKLDVGNPYLIDFKK
jgi:hypothetical protein